MEDFGTLARITVEYCKQRSICHSSRSFSERNSMINLARSHSYDILAKDLASFCSCPKNLPEYKLQNNGIIGGGVQ